jgi:hypothetical protein
MGEKEKKVSGGKGILERAVERMAKAFLVEAEEAGAGDSFVDPLGLALGGLKGGGFEIAAIDQCMDGDARQGEQFRDFPDLEEWGNDVLGKNVSICYHCFLG